jgi:thiol-disulfide isomerase/thioredoxin
MTGATIPYGRWICSIPAAFALAFAVAAPPAAAKESHGEPGELTETQPARPVPDLILADLSDDKPATLAVYRGRSLIINLWATWCAPCVKEMPSLAKLAAALEGENLAVVAVSEDRGGKPTVDAFLKAHDIGGLSIYLDKTMSAMKSFGGQPMLPMTVLIDAEGREVARAYGDRDWSSPESRAEVSKLLGLKTPG